jgi:hypothetical protein
MIKPRTNYYNDKYRKTIFSIQIHMLFSCLRYCPDHFKFISAVLCGRTPVERVAVSAAVGLPAAVGPVGFSPLIDSLRTQSA